MLNPKMVLCAATVAASLAMASSSPDAFGEDVADFFKGKTVTVVVPSGSGGTFHLYGQIAARHLARHIPGNPTVVIQNRPGAGGATAASYMGNAAPRDGTVIAENAPGASILPLLRDMKYDPRKFSWLGTLSVRTYTIGSWHTSPIRTFDDIRNKKFLVGASGVGGLNYQFPVFLNAVAGTKFAVITGYKGGGAINLAMERGEVHGRFTFYSAYTGAKPDWLRDHKIQFIARLGPSRPEVENLPNVADFIEGAENKKMYELLELGLEVGQSFYLPEGVPPERVAAMRTAFASMLKDPAMLADAAARHVPINVRDHHHVEKVIASAYRVDSELPKRLAKILGIDGGAKQ